MPSLIVTGTQAKKVIIRGIGPSLPLPGKLDPTLELHNGHFVFAGSYTAIVRGASRTTGVAVVEVYQLN